MSIQVFDRPALGHEAYLGQFYDARTDTFLEAALLDGALPASIIHETPAEESRTVFTAEDTYKKKCEYFKISPELNASLLAGMIEAQGGSSYLDERHDAETAVQAALYHQITTLRSRLDFTSAEMRDYLTRWTTDMPATHVVTEILYGAQTVASAVHHLRGQESRPQILQQAERAFQQFDHLQRNQALTGTPDIDANAENLFSVTIYSDIQDLQASNGYTPQSFIDAYLFMSNARDYVIAYENGRGAPLSYKLVPISFLQLLGLSIQSNLSAVQPSTECLSKFSSVFEHLTRAQNVLKHYHQYIIDNRLCVPSDHINSVGNHIGMLQQADEDLRLQFSHQLQGVRSGLTDPRKLNNLLEEFRQSEAGPGKTIHLAHAYTEKIEFVKMVVSHGGKYLKAADHTIQLEVNGSHSGELYILYFNKDLMNETQSWAANTIIMNDILRQPRQKVAVLIVDNAALDLHGRELTRSYIVHYRRGQLVTHNVQELQKFLADKCIVQYDPKYLDRTTMEKPVQRRPVKIPCPGPSCPKVPSEWLCFKCFTSIEFGFSDKFLYCDCGRCQYDMWHFRCCNITHGPSWSQYKPSQLLQTLRRLEPFEKVNILILGESGVGKSTFINSFVNYLTHSSLEDALAPGPLSYVVPCSFSTQNPDSTGRFIQRDIIIGKDEHELNGTAGQSATQRTTVYPIFMGSTLVRLIDTPGIGDTRGYDQDKENLKDILSVLRGYEDLHGVIILLKPNSSRLTFMFQFCIKELLLQLHKSAAHNIVFGFTNTRGSDYKPGDTFKPLEALLKTYNDVQIGLFWHNVYCFDSEGFRYLAARKQGVDFGRFDDYARSWQRSADEAQRLLDHVKSLTPHLVKSTLNLNETRYLISALIKPMAEIADKIKHSIQVNEDSAAELANRELSEKELVKRLHVQKKVLKAHPVEKPRTVCANPACLEFRNDGVDETHNTLTTVYKTFCHDPCYLDQVPVEKVGTPEIKKCWAFECGKSEQCRGCKHQWQEHLHILYELKEENVTVPDQAVTQAISKEKDLIKAAQLSITAKKKIIEEFKEEYRQIQKATAQFTVFLKENGIGEYNDATKDYLEHLIKEEKSKVAVGGNQRRLVDLEGYLQKHLVMVELFNANLHRGVRAEALDEGGVQRVVQKLFHLKHFGDQLRSVRDVIVVAHDTTIREKVPYRVRQRGRWLPSITYFEPEQPAQKPQLPASHRVSRAIRLGAKPRETPLPQEIERGESSNSRSILANFGPSLLRKKQPTTSKVNKPHPTTREPIPHLQMTSEPEHNHNHNLVTPGVQMSQSHSMSSLQKIPRKPSNAHPNGIGPYSPDDVGTVRQTGSGPVSIISELDDGTSCYLDEKRPHAFTHSNSVQNTPRYIPRISQTSNNNTFDTFHAQPSTQNQTPYSNPQIYQQGNNSSLAYSMQEPVFTAATTRNNQSYQLNTTQQGRITNEINDDDDESRDFFPTNQGPPPPYSLTERLFHRRSNSSASNSTRMNGFGSGASAGAGGGNTETGKILGKKFSVRGMIGRLGVK